uniref:Outer membrane beta-barrel protein n=1 Tax=Rhodopseudomonas palustris (strain BisA53) TaxID=316055 RepID=Q07TT2_RHOP5
MSPGPARARRHCAAVPRAVSACLLLTALIPTPVLAQALTSDLFRPQRGGFVQLQDLPLRKTPEPGGPAAGDDRLATLDAAAPSRIGKIPTYGTPAAAGASVAGYDSLNRKRQLQKFYPGQPKPKRLGPGNRAAAAPVTTATVPAARIRTPVSASIAGTVPGQPLRRRLKPDTDPFGAVGDYAGSFLVKAAVETSGGYDSNPARLTTPKASAFYVVAPELMVTSDWDRHALVADLRGSYTGYGTTLPPYSGNSVTSAPTNLDRPAFDGHLDGRLDVTRDTRLLGQLRMRLFTDNPGSPNIEAGLSKYPLALNTGATVGVDQNFNRLQVSAGATVDRTAYQDSVLTNGVTETNDDRNFNQYGGIARVSYDLMPGLKPFGEVQVDQRVHDTKLDRSLYERDSKGGYVKGGTSFEFSRLLTGEIGVGYAMRSYVDPRLADLTGLLTSASLVWSATPLTTAKFIAATSVDETTLAGVSGVLTRTYTAEVDHDFRRWLTAIGRFTWGTQDYQGSDRLDKFGSVGGELVYKMNRNMHLKAQLRHDWLNSNEVGASTAATVVMLGVRLQN